MVDCTMEFNQWRKNMDLGECYCSFDLYRTKNVTEFQICGPTSLFCLAVSQSNRADLIPDVVGKTFVIRYQALKLASF